MWVARLYDKLKENKLHIDGTSDVEPTLTYRENIFCYTNNFHGLFNSNILYRY